MGMQLSHNYISNNPWYKGLYDGYLSSALIYFCIIIQTFGYCLVYEALLFGLWFMTYKTLKCKLYFPCY